MAQETNKNVMWTVIVGVVLAIILIVGFMVINGKVNDANTKVGALDNKVNNAVNSIPSAADIASQIIVPQAPAGSEDSIIGSGSSGSGDGDSASQLLQAAYPVESGELEDDCYNALNDEFGYGNVLGDNVLYRVKKVIENKEGQEINPIDWSDVEWNYYDDEYFNVLNLGLGNNNLRAGEFTRTLRVEYTLEDGNQDDFSRKVYLIGTCSDWDKLDQRFDSLTLRVR